MTIFEEIKTLIANDKQLNLIKPIEEININDDFYHDIGLTSLGLVELIMICEDKFNFKFTDDEIIKIKTVEELVNLIENKKNGR